MFSLKFEKSMTDLLQKIEEDKCLILATVPVKTLKMSDKFKNNSRSKVFMVSFYSKFSLKTT